MRLASKQGEAGMRMSPGGDAQTLLALMHARAEVARLGEREQLFSTLMGGVNAVLWAFDWQAQRMIYVSPAYERIFGRSPALLLADYGEWRNAIYPDDVEYAQKSMLAVLDEGAPLGDTEGLFRAHTRGPHAGGPGSGMGLYIVRSIVEGWGGRAWHERRVAGNAFCFTVPGA